MKSTILRILNKVLSVFKLVAVVVVLALAAGAFNPGATDAAPRHTAPAVAQPRLPAKCGNDIITARPGANISTTLQRLKPGQTLRLAPGAYAINNGLKLSNSGTNRKPICVVAQKMPNRHDAPGKKAGTVTIKGGGSIVFNDTQWWRIQGLDFNSRSIQLTGSRPNTPFYFDMINNYHTTPNGGGDAVVVNNAADVTVRDSMFSLVRSNKAGTDRSAFILLNDSARILFNGNLCEDVSADCVQSQGNQSKNGGQIADVTITNNTMRINRPYAMGGAFCNSGENGIDVKVGRDWLIRGNNFSGYYEVPGCTNFESTSKAGEAVLLHKSSGVNFLIEKNTFKNNTEHILIIGKTCSAGGSNCGGTQSGENIIVRNNTFDNRGLSKAMQKTAVAVTPGAGANVRGIGDRQFKTTNNVLIEKNTFLGNKSNIQVRKQTNFQYGQNRVERRVANGVVSIFDPPTKGPAVPTNTTIRNNAIDGGTVQVAAGVECFGNQCDGQNAAVPQPAAPEPVERQLPKSPVSVTINSPVEDQRIGSSSITVDATVTDRDSRADAVKIVLSGKTWNREIIEDGPYVATFDDLPVGSYTVTVVAYNGGGELARASIEFRLVANQSPAPAPKITPPPPKSFELAVNPSFESDPTASYLAVDDDRAKLRWARGTARTGLRSLSLHVPKHSPQSDVRWVSRTTVMPVTSGSTNDISVYAKAAGLSGEVKLVVSYWTDKRTMHSFDVVTADGLNTSDWTKVSMTGQVPEDATYMRVAFRLQGPGTVWFDDLSVKNTP